MDAELQQLVDKVDHARASLLEVTAEIRDDQGAFKPTPTEWSVAENLEHLFLAEVGGITKIWTALNQYRAGERWSADLPNRGRSIEQVIASTWRPVEVAPAAAAPHLGGPASAWRSALRSLSPVLADLAVALAGCPLDNIIFPHALSGPLDARQRLEFLRFHIQRHEQQIHRVRSNALFPS